MAMEKTFNLTTPSEHVRSSLTGQLRGLGAGPPLCYSIGSN
jgi:hypothetical protein